MIVIDTHVLIWFVQGDDKLGKEARRKIVEEASDQQVLVPAISIWEVALVTMRNQVVLGMDVSRWVAKALDIPGFALTPLEPNIAVGSVLLDWKHKDPADRMIVATALHWRAPLLTVDRTIRAYAQKSDLEVIDAFA